MRVWRLAAAALLLAACGRDESKPVSDAPVRAEGAVITTSMGVIEIKLFADKAPKTVANFAGLASGAKHWRHPKTGKVMTNAPLYDGVVFHRVIPNFMIQTGDPLGNGRGDPGFTFEDETRSGLSFAKPGMLGMANHGPNTNGCQFFITVAPAPHLDRMHTIFGEVTSGLEVAQAISRVPRHAEDGSDRPVKPVLIESVALR